MPAISYQPDICKMSYGLFKCKNCKAGFYGGGEALHNSSCEKSGYESTYYCFGDNESWKLCFHISAPCQEIIDIAKSNPNEIIEY